jgi:hypothetical protein
MTGIYTFKASGKGIAAGLHTITAGNGTRSGIFIIGRKTKRMKIAAEMPIERTGITIRQYLIC